VLLPIIHERPVGYPGIPLGAVAPAFTTNQLATEILAGVADDEPVHHAG